MSRLLNLDALTRSPEKSDGHAAPDAAPHAEALLKTPSGIAGLDEILGGGLPTGRATLICGGAGCGKTLFGLTFLVEGTLRHGEPGVLMCFEETEAELGSNTASLGYDLPELVASGRLAIDYVRIERSEIEETGTYDLDGLFVRLDYAIKSVGVILDPVYNLKSASSAYEVHAMLLRLIDLLKCRGITALFTAIDTEGERDANQESISSLMDTRIQVRTIESSGERNRGIFVLKSRGMNHSNQIREFILSDRGIQLRSVYLGLGGVVAEAARADQIVAIPTLIRRLPEPIKNIIGDLSNEQRVLVGLDLQPVKL